ncbi:hypothetical protein CTI12_AA191150 [Artemisia annua]|uniref:Uncharacterized protein n=1 Tax=Artemisia annua TaxID=35608 RepID=A0A2U1P5U5_ARTAN|nr:hypothetical protein CTI12_AA191150 [Artemisia annua]
MGVRTASLNGITKGYSIELKPLFSALEMTSLAWTTIHSFALNYSDVLLHILQDAKQIASITQGKTSIICYNKRVDGTRAASCDAGPIFSEDLLMGVRTASLNGITKGYSIELKPLFSALEMTSLAWTTIHSFASNYSDVLLHIPQDAKRRDDERRDAERGDDEHRDVDMVLPFWNSVNQILRQTTVVTTRRVLERFVVHHCSQRTAWKLLKDLPESALRKSKRGMPFYTYTFCVARTTIKGNFLGVAASCLVLVGIECYDMTPGRWGKWMTNKKVADVMRTWKSNYELLTTVGGSNSPGEVNSLRVCTRCYPFNTNLLCLQAGNKLVRVRGLMNCGFSLSKTTRENPDRSAHKNKGEKQVDSEEHGARFVKTQRIEIPELPMEQGRITD